MKKICSILLITSFIAPHLAIAHNPNRYQMNTLQMNEAYSEVRTKLKTRLAGFSNRKLDRFLGKLERIVTKIDQKAQKSTSDELKTSQQKLAQWVAGNTVIEASVEDASMETLNELAPTSTETTSSEKNFPPQVDSEALQEQLSVQLNQTDNTSISSLSKSIHQNLSKTKKTRSLQSIVELIMRILGYALFIGLHYVVGYIWIPMLLAVSYAGGLAVLAISSFAIWVILKAAGCGLSGVMFEYDRGKNRFCL